MRVLALAAIAFFASPCQAEPPTCLIVKHASGFSAFANNANWEYVTGDFPKGMKWKGHLTDRNVRQIKEKGGRVIVIPQNYTPEDLAQAQKACSEQ